MAHPVLLAGGAAAVLALLFGSKKAHAMPANNGGGLQPPSAPPGGILGPTSAPAPSSGLPNNGVTAPYSYNSDDSGSVDFPTGNGVSAPAYNAPSAPSQSDGIGTFSNSDDNLPTATADSGAAGYDPNFLLSPGNPIDASVSGPLDDYASAVAGPYDSYTAAAVAGLSHHHGLERFSAHVGAPLPYRKGRKNPTASNHLPPHRGAQKARVGASLAPSGLVYDRHGNWTHAYPGHRWGAPPPAGQPIF